MNEKQLKAMTRCGTKSYRENLRAMGVTGRALNATRRQWKGINPSGPVVRSVTRWMFNAYSQ